jgi:hypothetical protein
MFLNTTVKLVVGTARATVSVADAIYPIAVKATKATTAFTISEYNGAVTEWDVQKEKLAKSYDKMTANAAVAHVDFMSMFDEEESAEVATA